MSSISSIGGGSLSQFLQSLSGTSQSSGVAATPSTSATGSTTATQSATGAVQGSGGHHHHGGHGMKQVQDAVTSALQSAQGSGSTTDPNQIVEDAISQVLRNNNGAAGSQTDPDGDGRTRSAAGGTANGASNTQTFLQTLQSYGIDPQKFHQDFLSAVKDAQNGSSNAGTAFQSFPVGSTIDTTA